jgi:hypothetical protein
MPESKVEIVTTHVLRLTAVISLCSANILLILENWAMFFFLIFLAFICEILHRKYFEVISHNRSASEYNQKNR